MYHDEITERCKLNFTGIVDDALRITGELFPKQTLKKYIRKEVEIQTDGRVRSRHFENKEKSLKATDIARATKIDRKLFELYESLKSGTEFTVPWNGRESEFSLQNGCIMYGHRVCIPEKYQNQVFEELHVGHPGIVKMKAIAGSYCYWQDEPVSDDVAESEPPVHVPEVIPKPKDVPVPATPSDDIPPKPVPDASGKPKTDVPLRRSNRIRRPPKRLDL
ncbi:uncharacterized protein K02A2.6-like [Trichonephila clavipes]|nr:uncharacterized protein K02A2.6-like [Trichonephila clavipes]